MSNWNPNRTGQYETVYDPRSHTFSPTGNSSPVRRRSASSKIPIFQSDDALYLDTQYDQYGKEIKYHSTFSPTNSESIQSDSPLFTQDDMYFLDKNYDQQSESSYQEQPSYTRQDEAYSPQRGESSSHPAENSSIELPDHIYKALTDAELPKPCIFRSKVYINNKKKVTISSQFRNAIEWSKQAGLNENALHKVRFNQAMTDTRAKKFMLADWFQASDRLDIVDEYHINRLNIILLNNDNKALKEEVDKYIKGMKEACITG